MSYRVPSPPAREPEPARELVYAPLHARDTTTLAALAFVALFGAGMMAAGLWPIGLFSWAAAGLGYLSWRRLRRGVVLRAGDGALEIDFSSRRERVTFHELEDVILDTKTIERVYDGPSPVPAVRILEGRSIEVDTARVVLCARTRDIPLGEERVAHLHAADDIAKIRVFLRRNGWVPKDER